MDDKKTINKKEVKENTQDQELKKLNINEVHVYGRGCGDPKIGCMVDCINLTPWLTTQM